MFTDILPCWPTYVDIEVNGITIRAICEHQEFDFPLGGLVLTILGNP